MSDFIYLSLIFLVGYKIYNSWFRVEQFKLTYQNCLVQVNSDTKLILPVVKVPLCFKIQQIRFFDAEKNPNQDDKESRQGTLFPYKIVKGNIVGLPSRPKDLGISRIVIYYYDSKTNREFEKSYWSDQKIELKSQVFATEEDGSSDYD